jgi:hypothetical protein
VPLLGSAAMLLGFDVAPEAIAEHDEWHTHEHLPERLSIPGFLRGTRWTAAKGQPRYFVLYEVERLETLSSAAYLERLDNPTPWTSRMMPHYRGMTRGLCTVVESRGFGSGHFGLLVRFKPAGGAESRLRGWLAKDILPRLPERQGLGSAHLFIGAAPARMTNEQRIRGADAGVDWALFVTGYDPSAVERIGESDLSAARLEANGAAGIVAGLYRADYTLAAQELHRSLRP